MSAGSSYMDVYCKRHTQYLRVHSCRGFFILHEGRGKVGEGWKGAPRHRQDASPRVRTGREGRACETDAAWQPFGRFFFPEVGKPPCTRHLCARVTSRCGRGMRSNFSSQPSQPGRLTGLIGKRYRMTPKGRRGPASQPASQAQPAAESRPSCGSARSSRCSAPAVLVLQASGEGGNACTVCTRTSSRVRVTLRRNLCRRPLFAVAPPARRQPRETPEDPPPGVSRAQLPL